jgi:hypothetical protein
MIINDRMGLQESGFMAVCLGRKMEMGLELRLIEIHIKHKLGVQNSLMLVGIDTRVFLK